MGTVMVQAPAGRHEMAQHSIAREFTKAFCYKDPVTNPGALELVCTPC